MALTDAVKLCLEINKNIVVCKENKAAICESGLSPMVEGSGICLPRVVRQAHNRRLRRAQSSRRDASH